MPRKRYGKKAWGTNKGTALNIRLNSEDAAKLDEVVADTGKSRSDIVRAAIRLYAAMRKPPA